MSSLHNRVTAFVNEHSRKASQDLYKVLCATLTTLPEEHIELLNILDAMTGYCAKEFYIGTGDYNEPV